MGGGTEKMILPLLMVFLLAFLLDFLLGDPHTEWHPVALAGRFASVIETLCRRVSDGICAGAAGWLILVGVCTFSAWITTWAACRVNLRFGVPVAGVWLYFCIALRSLIDHAEAIRRPLARGDLPEARRALSMIVSRDTAELDASSIVRGAIESLGENGIDGVNSALFWAVPGYFAFGVPGLAAGAVFQKDVEDAFSMNRSTATGILQLLVKGGFLRREPVDYDARLKRLIPTEKAACLDAKMTEYLRHMEQRLTHGLSAAQITQFKETAACMSANLTV